MIDSKLIGKNFGAKIIIVTVDYSIKSGKNIQVLAF